MILLVYLSLDSRLRPGKFYESYQNHRLYNNIFVEHYIHRAFLFLNRKTPRADANRFAKSLPAERQARVSTVILSNYKC